MAESIGVRELRQYASQWLERVQAGESFTVTDRGNPIARLVPLTESASDWRREWVEAGRMVAGDRSEAFSWANLQAFAMPEGVSSSAELLDDLRSDRV